MLVDVGLTNVGDLLVRRGDSLEPWVLKRRLSLLHDKPDTCKKCYMLRLNLRFYSVHLTFKS